MGYFVVGLVEYLTVVVAGLGVEGTEYFLVVGGLGDGVELGGAIYFVDLLAKYFSVVLVGYGVAVEAAYFSVLLSGYPMVSAARATAIGTSQMKIYKI